MPLLTAAATASHPIRLRSRRASAAAGIVAASVIGASLSVVAATPATAATPIVTVSANEVGILEGSVRANSYGSAVSKTESTSTYAWCATFVSWVAKQTGSTTFRSALVGENSSTGTGWLSAARRGEAGLSVTTTPVAGDLVAFDWGQDGSKTNYASGDRHIGIVETPPPAGGGPFGTIEGNTSGPNGVDGVFRKSRTTRSSYGVLFIHIASNGTPAPPPAGSLSAVAEGGLVQATGTPVAAKIGGALISFASMAELTASGFGGKPITQVSVSEFNAAPRVPTDGTMIQGADSVTPVAVVVGGAAISFASPSEVTGAGYGSASVRGVPARFFNSLPSVPVDGTLIQGAGTGGPTPVAAIIGGAQVSFASMAELTASGYSNRPVLAVPPRYFTSLPSVPRNGTLIQGADSVTPVAVIVGGARVNFASPSEVTGAGYAASPVLGVPARFFNGVTTVPANGTLIQGAGTGGPTPVAVIVGGAQVSFASQAELTQSGYAGKPVQAVPPRAFTAFPTLPANGTFVKSPTRAEIYVFSAGKRSYVGSPAQVTGTVNNVPQRAMDGWPLA